MNPGAAQLGDSGLGSILGVIAQPVSRATGLSGINHGWRVQVQVHLHVVCCSFSLAVDQTSFSYPIDLSVVSLTIW